MGAPKTAAEGRAGRLRCVTLEPVSTRPALNGRSNGAPKKASSPGRRRHGARKLSASQSAAIRALAKEAGVAVIMQEVDVFWRRHTGEDEG
jgi:hypothetical protein